MIQPEELAIGVKEEFTREGSAWEVFPPPKIENPDGVPYKTDLPCDVVTDDGSEYGPCWGNSGQFEMVNKDNLTASDGEFSQGFIYEERVKLVRYWVEKPHV